MDVYNYIDMYSTTSIYKLVRNSMHNYTVYIHVHVKQFAGVTVCYQLLIL